MSSLIAQENPETGEMTYFRKVPLSNGATQQISEQEARTIMRAERESPFIAGVGSALDAVQDTVGDTLRYGSQMLNPVGAFLRNSGLGGDTAGTVADPIGRLGEAIAEQNDPRQAERFGAYPGAAGIGTFAPDILSGGAGLVRGAGRGASRAATGPVRTGREATERAAGAVDEASEQFASNRAAAGRESTVGAKQAPTAEKEAGLSPYPTYDQADAVNIPMTQGERQLLKAWETGDLKAIKKAEETIANEDVLRKLNISGDVTAGDIWDNWRGQKGKKEYWTNEIAYKFGEPNLERITKPQLAKFRDNIQEVFYDAFDSGNYQVSNRYVDRDTGESFDLLANLQKIKDDTSAADITPGFQRILEEIDVAYKRGNPNDGTFDTQLLLQARKEASDAASRLFDNGKYDGGMNMSAVANAIDDAIEQALPESVLRDVRLARERWKIKKVLENRVNVMSKTDNGLINPDAFRSSYRALTSSYRRNIGPTTDFEKMMDFVADMSVDRSNAGNNLVRGIVPGAASAAKTGAAAAAGAGIAGALGLF